MFDPPAIKARGDYIGGRFVRPRHADAAVHSLDPGASERPVREFPVFHSAPERALAAARAAQPAWAALPVAARVAALQKLRAELRNRGEDLLTLISAETGRPLWETRGEVRAMYGALDGVLNVGLSEVRLHQLPAGPNHIEFRPLGVVVVLSPYSQPALLMHADAIAALAAGCTVACKPSEYAPAVGQLYAEIVQEADLPRGVFNLVQGDAATGQALASSPLADGVLFCGSEANGRLLLSKNGCSQDRMVRTVVSGHAAALVLDDANLDEAAYKIVIGACISAGQRCTSTRRIVVQRRVAEPLKERLLRILQKLRVGHATDSETFMGPLIRAEAMEEYLGHLRRVGAHAKRELCHGAPLSGSRPGFYVAPALFETDADGMIATSNEEVIGPLLTLATCGDVEQGVSLINQSPLGLVMSVFCRSDEDLARVRQLQTCGLCLHNLPTTKWPSKIPICPRGRSGSGVPGGIMTVRACTRLVAHSDADEAFDFATLPPGLPRE